MDLVNHLSDRLLFAVPKKGRLNEATLSLLSGSDIQFHRHSRLDIALVKNLPIALIFLPAADIPTFVGEGRVDLGITGRDQVAEHEAGTPTTERTGVEEIMDLGFGSCKLQVQVPEGGGMHEPAELVGRNVVTSFVKLTERYFMDLEARMNGSLGVPNGSADNGAGKMHSQERSQLRTKIKYVGGSVEAACALGVADGIVDLVESGETMRAAGLHAIDTVVESTAVLISSKQPSNPALVSLIGARLRGVITAQKYVMMSYNILRSGLAAACKITPGKRAPTINSLEEEGWVAVSAMVETKKSATVMDELVTVGAMDILVTRIENTRTG